MTEDTDNLQRRLAADLTAVADRLMDEERSTELYRALASVAWFRGDGDEGHLALSWTLAERLVNDVRLSAGHPPLELAQTGGEGVVSPAVEEQMSALGWHHRPLNTGRRDERHVGEPDERAPHLGEPPPGRASTAERFARAHEAAHENARRRG